MRRARIFSLGLTILALGCSSSDSGGEPGAAGGEAGKGASGAAGKAGGGGAGAAGQGGAAGKGGAGAGGTAGGAAGASGSTTLPLGGSAGAAGTADGGGQAGVSGGSGQAGGAVTGGTSGASGSSGEQIYCASSADCAGNASRKTCDTTTGRCVGCVVVPDECPTGSYCQSQSKTCVSGCKADTDCASDKPLCDTKTHACSQCLDDSQCADGYLCEKGLCAQGCSDTKPCLDGAQTCCGGTCHTLASEVDHCGSCGKVCPQGGHAASVCSGGSCGLGGCDPGFADCNGQVADGCEVDTSLGAACVCTPGSTKPCYDGPAGTENVGICKGGVQVCAPSGLGYIPGCVGQVLPQQEVCGDGLDHNCDGAANNVPDIDGDGWTECQGDCCEYTYQCGTPNLVNPGAYDVPGDSVDDDCNGVLGPLDCSIGQKFTGVLPTDLATAMELCQFTNEAERRWGVISAQLLLASGAAPNAQQMSDMQNWQTAVLNNYGNNGPRRGPSMVGMSSGRMRDKNDPGYVAPNGGAQFGSVSTPPASYLAAHGGNLPASAGCSGGCAAGSGANDSVLLRLRIRVPTNAKSLSYDFRFFSSEYWTYQCSSFNDFYLAQLQTGAPGIPADRNISFDSKNNPVSVNNGFFEVCKKKGCNVCPSGTGDLLGTGMEDNDYTGNTTGGATKWLTTVAPVVPGEIITLDFSIFDVSDWQLDSLSLLDNFTWLATPSSGPSTGPAK